MSCLQQNYAGLSSTKVTERSKCYDKLQELLETDKDTVEYLNNNRGSITWNSLFRQLLSSLNIEIQKMEAKAKTGMKENELRLVKCNSVISVTIAGATKTESHLDIQSFISSLKRCTQVPKLKEHCLSNFIHILKEHILANNVVWGCITEEEWSDIFQIVKGVIETNMTPDALKCLVLIVRNGPVHRMSLNYLRMEADFITGVCLRLNSGTTPQIKEYVLEVFIDFCKQIMDDYRELCCKLGENVLQNLFYCYEGYITKSSVMSLLFEAVLIQVNIHHPKGASSKNKMSYADCWTTWQRHMKCIIQILTEIIDNHIKDVLESNEINNVPLPLFLELCVEVFKQVYENYEHASSNSIEDEQPQVKKHCFAFNLTNILKTIEKSKRNTWIFILVGIVQKYPTLFSAEQCYELLQFLVNYLGEVKCSITRGVTLACLSEILNAEFVLKEKAIFNWKQLNMQWDIVWEYMLRYIGLNQNIEETHRLIRRLIPLRDATDSIELLKIFASKNIALTRNTLQTVKLIGQNCAVTPTMRDQLIEWILYTQNHDMFREDILAELLVNLCLKQWICEFDGVVEEKRISLEYVDLYAARNILHPICYKIPKNKRETDQKEGQVHTTVFADLLKSLQTMIIDKRNLKKNLNMCLLLGNLGKYLNAYKKTNEALQIDEVLQNYVIFLWEMCIKYFKTIDLSIYDGDKSYILQNLPSVFALINNIGLIVSNALSADENVALVKRLFDILQIDNKEYYCSDSNFNEPLLKIKMGVLDILCSYAIHSNDSIQKHVLDTLVDFTGDPKVTFDYVVMMKILNCLKKYTRELDESTLYKVFSLIQKICEERYTEYEVASSVLAAVEFIYPHVALTRSKDLHEAFLVILTPFCDNAQNYGPTVSVNIANCFGKIVQTNLRQSLVAASKLSKLAGSDYLSVRLTCVRHLAYFFAQLNLADAQFYNEQMTVFKNTCKMLQVICDKDTDSNDDNLNRQTTVFYLFASIIVSSGILRQECLFHLLKFVFMKELDIDKLCILMQTVSDQLHLKNSLLLLETNLQFLLVQWKSNHYPWESFPIKLYKCSTMKEFYEKFTAELTPLLLSDGDNEVVDKLCSDLGKSKSELLEIAFPKIVVDELLKVVQQKNGDFINNIVATYVMYLSSETCLDLLKEKINLVIVNLIKRVFDLAYFGDLLKYDYHIPSPATMHITIPELSCALQLLQEKLELVSAPNLIQHYLLKSPNVIQAVSLRLREYVYKAISTEEKLIAFYQYITVIELIDFKSNVNAYFIRDIAYSLLDFTKRDFTEELPINMVAARFFAMFISTILPKHCKVVEKFVIVIINTLIPIARKRNSLGSEAKIILDKLIIDHGEHLNEVLVILDPIPSDLECLHKAQRDLKCRTGECDLDKEVKHFLQAGNKMAPVAGCRTEGLHQLYKLLSEHKEELAELYNNLYNAQGTIKGDSILHSLLCSLIQLSASTNSEESLAASKCLGELGPADLTTIVLKSEDVVANVAGSSTCIATAAVLSFLSGYLVNENIEVVKAASEALYHVVNSVEGKEVITRKLIPDVEYFQPFTINTGRKYKACSIDKEACRSVITNRYLWCPAENKLHSAWIVDLVCSILRSFSDRSYFYFLIDVCHMNIDFAEKLLPYLVNILLDFQSDSYVHISECISTFFQAHWTLNLSNANCGSVAMQKTSIECLLNTVHFAKLHGNMYLKCNDLKLRLNYLHVALAAQFCSQHFSTITYVEMWCQTVVHQLRKQKKPLPFGTTVLDFVCANSEESKTVYSILRQSYNYIGDKDALNFGQIIDPFDSQMEMNTYIDTNRWDLLLLHSDSCHSVQDSTQNTLKNLGLYNFAGNISDEIDYECLWRLSKWDTEISVKRSEKFEFFNYTALKSLKEQDNSGLNVSLWKGRKLLVDELRTMSLESCNNLYSLLTKLQCLQELEEVGNALNGEDLKRVLAKWKSKDAINPNDFQYREAIASHRIAMFGILVDDGHDVSKALFKMKLDLAEMSRLEGNLNISKRVVQDLLKIPDLSGEDKMKVMLENAQIYWGIDHKTGMNYLNHLLKTFGNESLVTSTALNLYGQWLAKTNSESSKIIIKYYFLKSIDMLSKVINDSSEKEVQRYYEFYNSLAQYADQLYQEVLKYTLSPSFKNKVHSMEKFLAAAVKLEEQNPNQKTRSDDVRRAIATYRRMGGIDSTQVENTMQEKNTYLKMALKYYLFDLKHSDKHDMCMFRVVSLWLENSKNSDVMNILNEFLHEIPSFKVLLVLPQLVPHITNDETPFGRMICSLIERCTKDHPHHALPLVLSMANSNKDDDYMDTSASSSNNEVGRVIGAQKLIQNLKRNGNLKKIILQMEKTSEALIELAYLEIKKEDRPKMNIPIKVPTKFAIKKIRNFDEMLLPTCHLPISRNCVYGSVIGVHKFSDDFYLVGGMNAPKRITCRGTDGIVRNQLIKGKDDLRQDAVMQQVFSIMNTLFANDKTTFNLLIRTYKIIPLSKRSGILEWVDNTNPFGNYLVGPKGTHSLYNSEDVSATQCREEFAKLSKDSNEMKLKKFLKICERFQPAFHKFFETKFLQPTEWYQRRKVYTQSVATNSMCGYILGLGDRHVQNILIDENTAEVVHIDFGIAFEQGKILPTPETIPFRLTRDIEAGMGVSGVEGTFRRSCEKTIEVLRKNKETIVTILEVLLYDPLYAWTISPAEAYSRQMDKDSRDCQGVSLGNDEATSTNLTAERALGMLRQKLEGIEHGGFSSVESQVSRLIQQARDPANLCKLFVGWQPYL